jgi:hypothetical protein
MIRMFHLNFTQLMGKILFNLYHTRELNLGLTKNSHEAEFGKDC